MEVDATKSPRTWRTPIRINGTTGVLSVGTADGIAAAPTKACAFLVPNAASDSSAARNSRSRAAYALRGVIRVRRESRFEALAGPHPVVPPDWARFLARCPMF